MPAFSAVAHAKRKPPTFVVLEPADWCQDYPNVPTEPVAVGVFPISEKTLQTVIGEAAKDARLYLPDAAEDDPLLNKQFEESLLKLTVARATCDPNDVTQAYFQHPDDEVGEAWPPGTIRRIWDELERVTIETSAVTEPADDEDLERLADMLSAGLVGKLVSSQELRIRKLAAFMIGELSAIQELEV